MARYPKDNATADKWLRRIVKDFMAENDFKPADLNCAARAKGVWHALFGRHAAKPIPDFIYPRVANGLAYLAECRRRGWINRTIAGRAKV